jgi:hypothetical protein
MPNAQDIIKLEHRFWDTMTSGDHEESAKLLAPKAAMVSDMGSMSFTPSEYVKMGQSSQFKIKDWSLTDEEVIFPTPNTAICMYKVKQTLEKDGVSQTTQNNDTSVWTKEGADWKCILHTESPITTTH